MTQIRNLYTCILWILLSFCAISTSAQFNLEDADLERIPQRKVRFYITNQIKNDVRFITDIRPSILSGQDVSNYWTHKKTIIIENNPGNVIKKYFEVDLRKIWNKKPISFGLLLSKKDNKAIYKNDPFKGVEEGQVYYLNLQFLKGIYNIAVAFEILTLDIENRIIEFSYLNDGVAKGIQKIQFLNAENGNTQIIHESIFKSNSNFRDKYLYPFFHKRFIDEFHKSVNS